MTSRFQRARQPAQKEQRREHLLATARTSLAQGTTLPALSLNGLARAAGMAKANVYTYFSSREELLLALLSEEWGAWAFSLRKALSSRGRRDVASLVGLLARTLADAPLLCELTAALPTVLEQNLTEEAIRAFKHEALLLFTSLSDDIARAVPRLSTSVGVELLHDAVHAIMALHPATHPSPAAARALADPALRFFRRDLPTELERFLGALAADHERRERSRPSSRRSSTGRGPATALRPTRGTSPATLARGRDRSPGSADVTAYVDAVDEPVRTRLRTLRAAIRAAAPDAVERIAWGMPTWHQGENLLHVAAFSRHIGLYPGPAAIVAFTDDLATFTTSRGAIQLPHAAPLPVALVERLTRWRVQQAATKATKKTATKKKATKKKATTKTATKKKATKRKATT